MIGMNRYRVSQLVSQVPTMLALVRAGTGCALVPRSITAMAVHGVRYRELAAADAHSVTLHACWSPDNPNPALQRLVESGVHGPFGGLQPTCSASPTMMPSGPRT
jgi:DNA-binding transcriptional LysR family regulator